MRFLWNGNPQQVAPSIDESERHTRRLQRSLKPRKGSIITTADAPDQPHSLATDVDVDLDVDHAALDEPRGNWQAALEAAARCENQLSLVLQRLEDNAERRSADEAALQAAIDQQAELKRAIKTTSEQRETLRKARSKAQREAEAARKQAHAAEARYDAALLTEVLAAQKAKDLSMSDGRPAAAAADADAVATPVAPSTAQTTAAAVTARNAGI